MSGVRIDKWLWAARFFKTRSLATDAVDGGRIRLNGERPKPAKEVKIGDRIDIRIGQFHHDIAVTGLADRRGSATVAAALYSESEESRAARAEVAARLRAMAQINPFKGRPTKRTRRQIEAFDQAGPLSASPGKRKGEPDESELDDIDHEESFDDDVEGDEADEYDDLHDVDELGNVEERDEEDGRR